jgi:uncharacterized protein (DUF924 family)
MDEARNVTPADVLAFWREAGPERWFAEDSAFDAEVRRRFFDLWRAAADGQFTSWEAGDDGKLALVIVLDQFPRNMFRGDPRAYTTDALARDLASRAIEGGVDLRVDPLLREFLYMPLMHSENLSDQEHCVELFSKAGAIENLKYAEHHADIIRRFGRFPHRNPVLGRTTTADEQTFLDSDRGAG